MVKVMEVIAQKDMEVMGEEDMEKDMEEEDMDIIDSFRG